MVSIQRQIDNLPKNGGTTKGVYLPNKLIKHVLQNMKVREDGGDYNVSFAKIIQEILTDYYGITNSLKQVA